MAGPSASSAADRARREGSLATPTLDTRPHRPPDYAAESSAMHRLAQALTSSDGAMLQTLSDMALSLCDAGSAGIGLVETDTDGTPIFRWVAVSGACVAAVGSTIPIAESPGGVTLELATGQLFSFPQRHFAFLKHIAPEIVEELVVPIPGEPEPWGTLWVMSHDRERVFDAEDRRILTSLANFTCATLTMTRAKADAEARAAEAEASRNALTLAEARKDDFIALLSHELRNPLAPIDSALTAARKLATDNPAVLSALGIADRQMRILKRLVGDLLDASRIRHGKLSVRPSYGLLQDIVADAVMAMKADVRNGEHRIHVTIPPFPVTVHADAARLTQVISNLLTNAVKYTPPGGDITLSVEAPDLSIEPIHDSSPRTAVITVRDNGAGISSSLLPHVFEMFAQSASARGKAEGGLGIGLAVVKHLVAAHNGTVIVASDGEGQGTEVTVQLPIVCKSMSAPVASATRTMAPTRILLVDDNADATAALGTLLELEGHEVKRALSGPDALSIVESFTPDVALIDITMPGMDGIELAQLLRLRAQCSLTKLVALTGSTDAPGRPQIDERIFDCHLIKPLSLDDLADVMRS
ncbi:MULTISPECIES: hybrid sensor histidine kinase/response regulator [unclassified Paraburkholderia]|uniref:hybrid sensor histidine kinase/response regulator n=1 Tax=unclassified Paraburkholderia TaxID=2615204 RepID=UPI00160A4521|nr:MULTISPECIES: hybrid sensor histidine kinase/response regulator [unclassified Paraburkholderia]MBB5443129.1 signal transduction histidine kinase [Paraburkholderia sp. WSM4177]MBB5483266.1 signal transduction histidine kinase [Paraburkholderia sp. WSM4180]